MAEFVLKSFGKFNEDIEVDKIRATIPTEFAKQKLHWIRRVSHMWASFHVPCQTTCRASCLVECGSRGRKKIWYLDGFIHHCSRGATFVLAHNDGLSIWQECLVRFACAQFGAMKCSSSIVASVVDKFGLSVSFFRCHFKRHHTGSVTLPSWLKPLRSNQWTEFSNRFHDWFSWRFYCNRNKHKHSDHRSLMLWAAIAHSDFHKFDALSLDSFANPVDGRPTMHNEV